MNSVQLGSTLLHKYRIDRFRRRKDGVLVYEGIDTSRCRRVSVKLLERVASLDAVKCARFHDEAHGANVIDIGTCDGLAYFVTAEHVLAPPPPRKRPSSVPPPLPKPKPKSPPLPDIPIFVDDDAIVASTPAAPPPIPSDRVVTAFEAPPPERKSASWALLFAGAMIITGLGGWYIGRAQSDITPAIAPEPISAQPVAAEPQGAPPPVIEPVVATTQPIESAPPADPSSKPRPRPTTDPLTL